MLITSSANVMYESNGYFFNKHFISLDPDKYYIPLVTTEITEPRLALQQISSVNYSTASYFLSLNI